MTNAAIAKAWFAAIDRNDYDEIRRLVHPAHKFYNPMTPMPAGIDEHIGMMQMMASAFSGEHKLELIIEDEHYAVVRAKLIANHTGNFNGIAPTGKPVEITFIDIFEIEEGKVRKEILEMNPMSIMVQIGASIPA